MTKFIFIFGFIITSNLYAINLDIETEVITDEQAIELGMTEVTTDKKLGRGSDFKFKDEYIDLAKIVILINKSVRTEENPDGQTIRVYQDGVFLHEFSTSTGTEKLKKTTSGRLYWATTPVGIFRPKKAFKEYQSYTFKGANMDYAVFFIGGIATHSTSKAAYAKLGERASGGCARLKYEDAKTVNEIIRSTGEGHNRLWDQGTAGLMRMQYSDRIKLYNLSRENGEELIGATLWTYDAAIVVVN